MGGGSKVTNLNSPWLWISKSKHCAIVKIVYHPHKMIYMMISPPFYFEKCQPSVYIPDTREPAHSHFKEIQGKSTPCCANCLNKHLKD